jgi:hypothetical protein
MVSSKNDRKEFLLIKTVAKQLREGKNIRMEQTET